MNLENRLAKKIEFTFKATLTGNRIRYFSIGIEKLLSGSGIFGNFEIPNVVPIPIILRK